MIKILCLVSDKSAVLAIKKRIQDEIIACKELPYYQRWVRPGSFVGPIITDNCEIDFRSPNPDNTGGINVDLVYGVFDCDYSDEVINMLTGKRDLGLQKKYGKSELPIWEIVLEIEKRYAKVTEGMFKEDKVMKCMFQDCSLEATEIVPCEIGKTGENMDVHVCKVHYDLLNNKSVSVSMEIKEEEND